MVGIGSALSAAAKAKKFKLDPTTMAEIASKIGGEELGERSKPALDAAAPELPAFDGEAVLATGGGRRATRKAVEGKGDVFSRLGDYFSSGEGKAALFRFGAGTLQGGMGKGAQAAIDFTDGRRADREKARQFDLMQGLRERGVNIDEFQAEDASARGWGAIGVDEAQLREASRHNQAQEGLTARGQDVDRYGISTRAQVDVRGQDVSRANNTDDNAVSMRGQDVTREGNNLDYNASIYGTNVGFMGATQRAAAGIGSRGPVPTVTTSTVQDAKPPVNRWFGPDEPGSPKVTTTVRTPMGSPAAPAAAAPPAAAIQALRDNPGLKVEFEAKYGPGSAAPYLGGR